MRLIACFIVVLLLSSCFVTQKEYLALETELKQVKASLVDDDEDGVPNFRDQEANTNEHALADVKGKTGKIEKIVDRDEDGTLDVDDFCPTIKGKSNGCPDTDEDGFYDFLDKCPNEAGIDSLAGCPIPKPPVVETIVETKKTPINYGIRFVDKTSRYRPKTKNVLDTLIQTAADSLLKNPDLKLEIRSFTDSIGDSLTNLTLCEKRAEQVKKLLNKQGVEESRILIKAMGSKNPKHANDTKEGREANNRIEFRLIFKEEQ